MISTTRIGNISVRHTNQSPTQKTVIFLHAMAGSATAWDLQLLGLSDRYHCFAWDMPGFGESDPVPADMAMPQVVDALAELVRGLGIDSAHFVGLSVGGMILQHFAARYPELAESLAILDSSPKFGFGGDMKPAEFADSVLEQLATDSVNDFSEGMVRAIVGPDCPEDKIQQAIDAMSRAQHSGLTLTTHLIANHDALEALPKITCPVLAMAGAQDAETPPAYAFEIAQRVINGHVSVIPDSGHISNIENPQAVTERLRVFLDHQL